MLNKESFSPCWTFGQAQIGPLAGQTETQLGVNEAGRPVGVYGGQFHNHTAALLQLRNQGDDLRKGLLLQKHADAAAAFRLQAA